jgi:hypothetical protein
MDHYAHLLPGVDQSHADLLDESEADWQRFGSRSKKQVSRLENQLNLFDFLEPPVGFEPTTC